MKIIVDANIVFSAILNTDGKIGDLLINSNKLITFIAPDFLRKEITKHQAKMLKISKMNLDQIKESEFLIFKNITFISEEQVKPSIWQNAFQLVHDIDPNDTPYVAFAKQFRCKIWSGDKALIKGLHKKGFENVITTKELYDWRIQKMG